MTTNSHSRKILVTGSRGILGKILSERLFEKGYQVVGTRRESQVALESPDEVVLHPWRAIQLEGHKIDAVIHLAGKYMTKSDLASQKETFDSVVGVSAAVADLIATEGIPLVAVGSFFEKCPEFESPWSHYSVAKVASRELLRAASQTSSSPMSYIYLYDTFGAETSRGKFLDLLLENLRENQPLNASEGYQVQDLTHVDDVVAGLIQALEGVMLSAPAYTEWQIRSHNALTLRQLVNLIDEEFKVKMNVRWGALPYRRREVFEIWDSAADLPEFQSRIKLTEYLHSINTGDSHV